MGQVLVFLLRKSITAMTINITSFFLSFVFGRTRIFRRVPAGGCGSNLPSSVLLPSGSIAVGGRNRSFSHPFLYAVFEFILRAVQFMRFAKIARTRNTSID